MKRILFLINTECQFLLSWLYSKEFRADFTPFFAFLLDSDKRFHNFDFDKFDAEYGIYKNDITFNMKGDVDLKFLELLQLEGVEEILFANPIFLTNYSIIKTFKKRNKLLRVILLTDGLAFNEKYILSNKTRIKILYILLLRRIYNRIPNIPYLGLWTYRSSFNLINAYINTFPVAINKEYINIDILFNKINESAPIIKGLFNCSKSLTDYDVIILGIAFTDEYLKEYLDVLRMIDILCQKYNLRSVIKPHPSEQLERFKAFSFDVIFDNIPAEILISELKNKLVISCSSSVAAYNLGVRNKYVWFYKMINYPPQTKWNYTHIREVENEEQLEDFIAQFKIAG